jgi:hypothetical protein
MATDLLSETLYSPFSLEYRTKQEVKKPLIPIAVVLFRIQLVYDVFH